MPSKNQNLSIKTTSVITSDGAKPGNPIVVIAPHFCAPYPVDLTISKKLLSIGEVKGKLLSIRDRRVLVDAAGVPLVSLQQKIVTCHRRWQLYRGDSSDSKDLLFSVKKSKLLQLKTSLNVFLASNTSENVCDFKIKGSFFERSCAIYAGDSNNIIAQRHKLCLIGYGYAARHVLSRDAQMRKKHTVQSIVLDQDTYSITVYPNVDYAFIVALCVVLNEINMDRSDED
ncbi:hypothetical protein C5167_014675 [Papaver somniferum]|uniref:Tubby C-terminal domain-containing protein n=1 Tax=Papaver somniferum TaxID=3469 RepID=A0A4Y7J5V2_PAPSO|nr:hypothetical protein C5167_014675 [Papaver somniferum]